MARPIESSKSSQFILLASFAIVITGLYFAREVLIPIALAVLFTFLLTPPSKWLEKLHMPRAVATMIVVLLGMGAIGGLGYTAWRQLSGIVDDLPTYQVELQNKIKHIGEHGVFFRKVEKEAQAITSDSSHADGQNKAVANAPSAATQPYSENPLPVRVIPPALSTWAALRDYGATLLSPMATAALVLVFVVFMLLSREDLRDRLIRLLGSGRLNLTTQALDEASTRISNYLGALAIVNSCYALLTTGGLWIIGKSLGTNHGFPNVLFWGILVGVLRFVPYVGIWIGAGIPLLLSFALFSGNSVFFATLGLFATLEIIVSQFVEPMWYGSSTGMSALAVLVAAVFWTWLWGPIGLLLSTPLTVILVVMGKYIPQLKFIDILLREEAVLSPPFRLYQRLIAMDQEDAADLARDYLVEKKSLEAVFDDLLVPALSMAEHDSHHERATDEQLQFVRQSVRDLVEELAEQFRQMLATDEATAAGVNGDASKVQTMLGSAASTVASTVAAVASNVAAVVTGNSKSADSSPDQPATSLRASTGIRVLPRDCSISVLCLPARDEADEIVASMLGQLLEVAGYSAYSPTAAMLASEMVEMIESKKVQVVFVSAMPPAAVAHARYLCKRIHARFSEIGLIVGLWTMKGDLAKAKDRIACSSSVRLVTTLHDVSEQVQQMAHPLVIRAAAQTTA